MINISQLQNSIDFDDDMKIIVAEFKKYDVKFTDIAHSAIGKYTINQILQAVEESLNYLETSTPKIFEWVEIFLNENRSKLWLLYGIEEGNKYTNYWKINKTDFVNLEIKWPFLYNRQNHEYNGFIIDLKEAQTEIIRQEERRNTTNPNYKTLHPNGCPSGCSCWMLDCTEQWYKEEEEEIKKSTNIFFNKKLQNAFYLLAINELDELKDQWGNWMPYKINNNIVVEDLLASKGQTTITIIKNWIKNDFSSSIFYIFSSYDKFKKVWDNVDNFKTFIQTERKKLKKIRDIYNKENGT